jgi:hypothetical protein
MWQSRPANQYSQTQKHRPEMFLFFFGKLRQYKLFLRFNCFGFVLFLKNAAILWSAFNNGKWFMSVTSRFIRIPVKN